MFKRILVPLDGSERAERAIPMAVRIARASGGSVQLMRVVTFALDTGVYLMQPPDFNGKLMEIEFANATEYLKGVAESTQLSGVVTETQVYRGLPADTILSVASSQKIDMIVLCSHGDTGLKRWMLGSVAQKVARHSTIPVIVLRHDSAMPANDLPFRVLVALDGSPLAETVLVPAVELSVVLSPHAQGSLHLVRVLPLPQWESGAEDGLLKEAKEGVIAEAKAYMCKLEQRLREGPFAAFNFSVTSSVILDRDVAATIIEEAQGGEKSLNGMAGATGCEAIVMATHGRSGFKHWVMGSMTERVLGATKLPLLIVRPELTDIEEKNTVSVEVREKEKASPSSRKG